jgi:hypothetical protein
MRKTIDNVKMLALTASDIAGHEAMMISDLAALERGHAERLRELKSRYAVRLEELHRARRFYSSKAA